MGFDADRDKLNAEGEDVCPESDPSQLTACCNRGMLMNKSFCFLPALVVAALICAPAGHAAQLVGSASGS
ncbi:MAG: hypothetical protein ACLPV8_26460, partial [Steroidobacteraceae bacterium]